MFHLLFIYLFPQYFQFHSPFGFDKTQCHDALIFIYEGTIKALREAGIPFDLVAGVSMGSQISGLIAAGTSLTQMCMLLYNSFNCLFFSLFLYIFFILDYI